MSDREEILEKIRKLQAHADSAQEIGNEAEAQAFAAKVQELLTAYKLSAADMGTGQRAQEEPVDHEFFGWESVGLRPRKTRVPWAERLAHLVSRAYYCEFIVARYDGGACYIGIFCGAETDRKTCVYMFAVLARFLEREAERKYNEAFYALYNRGGDVSSVRGFRAGFVHGFLERLWERFEQEIRRAEDAPSTGTAMVLVRKGSLSKVHDYMRDKMKLNRVRGTALDSGNGSGRAEGRRAADKLDLGRRAMEGAAPERSRLR